MELIYLLFSCPQLCAHNCVWHLNCVRQCALTIATQDNPADLWQLRHWLQFLQLRIWIHDNLCYLTIKSDSGQHSQFLRCFDARLWVVIEFVLSTFILCSRIKRLSIFLKFFISFITAEWILWYEMKRWNDRVGIPTFSIALDILSLQTAFANSKFQLKISRIIFPFKHHCLL